MFNHFKRRTPGRTKFNIVMAVLIGIMSIAVITTSARAEPLPSDCPDDQFFLDLHAQVTEQTIVALDRMRDSYRWREENGIGHTHTIYTYPSMFSTLWETVTDSQWWLLGKNCRK